MLQFLITFGSMTLVMTMMIAVLLMLRTPMRRHFTARCRYIIWAVVILRLCIPVGIGFLPTLITLPAADSIDVYDVSDGYIMDDTAADIPDAADTPMPSTAYTRPYHISGTAMEDNTSPGGFDISPRHIYSAIISVWLLGALVFIEITFVKYLKNIRIIKRELALPTQKLTEQYDSLCREMGIGRAPQLYIGSDVTSPMACGFIRTCIIIPRVALSPTDMSYILRHELIHYKRRDLWLKLASMIANALQWFNPLVYIACAVFATETEMSCDEAVLREADDSARLRYGDSMLTIVKNCRTSPYMTTGFNPKNKAVKQRFENIVDSTRKRKGRMIVTAVIIASVVCTCIVGCGAPKEKNEDGESYTGATETVDRVVGDSTGTKDDGNGSVNDYPQDDGVGEIYDMDIACESQPVWTTRFADGMMILESADGTVKYQYGDPAVTPGVIRVDPIFSGDYTWGALKEDYIFITYHVAPAAAEGCEHATAVLILSAGNGEVLYNVFNHGGDMVSLHGLPDYALSNYTDKDGTNLRCSVSNDFGVYESDPDKIVIATEIRAGMTYLRGHRIFDPDTGILGELVATEQNLTSEATYRITDTADMHTIDGIGDDTVRGITAFVNKDTHTLEEMGGYRDGLLDDYTTLDFGRYSIFRNYDDEIYLEIEVLSSGCQAVSADMVHTFSFVERGGYILHKCCRAIEYTSGGQARRAVANWMIYSPNLSLPDKVSYEYEDIMPILCVLKKVYNAREYEDYRRLGKKVFGLKGFMDDMTKAEFDDIYEQHWAYFSDANNHIYSYEEIVVEDDEVVLQFYSDQGRILPAFKMKYEFLTEDGIAAFVSAKRYDDTGRAPYVIYYGPAYKTR